MIIMQELEARTRSKLESYVTETMRQNHLYGLSMCLVKEGEVVYSNGFGSRSIDPPRPATRDTLYGIGSSTKLFTALAVLKLVEAGKISLDDPVQNYVKGLETDSRGHTISIHQLLTHSSGYPDLGMAEGVLGHMLGQPSMWTPLGRVEDLVNLINEARDERVSHKGDTFMYWNEGYILLGKVIEEASGQGYTDYISRNITAPLEMKRSTFDRSRLESDEDGMVGYSMGPEGSRVPQRFPAHPMIDAAGGLITSVSELSHFVRMLMNGGTYNGRKIVSSESLGLAFTPHVKTGFPRSILGGESYGYGITISRDFLGHTQLGHGGNVAVSSAYFGFIPDLKIGITLAANSDFVTAPLADYALALMMGKDPEKTLPGVEFQRMAETLSGRYETFRGAMEMQVSLNGTQLVARIGKEPETVTVPLILEGRDVFVPMGPDKVKVDVSIHSHDRVDIRYDRLVFHRIGK